MKKRGDFLIITTLCCALLLCSCSRTISTENGDTSSDYVSEYTYSEIESASTPAESTESTESEPSSVVSSAPPAVSSQATPPPPVPSTLPVVSTPEPSPLGGNYAHAISAAQGLSTARIPYGFGNNVDQNNRPTLALSQQNTYSHLGLVTMTDEASIIYLTFDEGYENGYTPLILDALALKQVKAVFFVTMSYVRQNPTLVQRMINEGHVVGNHSVNHPDMTTLSPEKVVEEVMVLHEYMVNNFGYEMHLFRPPTGAYSEAVLAQLKALGYRTMEWSFAYADWDTSKQPDPAASKDKILSKSHSGAIYLLHAVSSTNTQILPELIDGWRNMGYTINLYPNIAP